MWKAAAGTQIDIKKDDVDDDEWETDPDFVNDVDEQEQRWGSTTVAGSGRTAGAIDMQKLRKETEEADAQRKKKLLEGPDNPSFGYGGKFGIQKDRMDQSAVGHEYKAKLEKHASQKDYTTGFGGKFGLQTDRVDKCAVSWDHKEKIEKHASQKDYVSGFGGKFGVQSDRQDKSAVGWDHVEKVEKHESQKDYSKGFGGKFGLQSDRQDKSAVGWDHHEAPQKHESQTDHKIGFGGKFGVQKDRMDKSAATFNEEPTRVGTNYTKVKPDIGGAKPSDLRAKFESMGSSQESQPNSSTSSPAPRKVHAKAALFTNKQDDSTPSTPERTPKQLDQSKMAFLTETSQSEVIIQERVIPSSPERTHKQLDQSKMAFLTETRQPEDIVQEKVVSSSHERTPKQLDQSKMAFLTETIQPEAAVQEKVVPKQLDQTKIAHFSASSYEDTKLASSSNQIREEIQQIRQTQKQEKQIEEEQIYENLQNVTSIVTTTQKEVTPPESTEVTSEDQGFTAEEEVLYANLEEIVDTGISAIALYDYQAAAEDEISFDPDDIITHIEKIDEGWWRGLCKGRYGLFPANYVQVQE